MGDVGDFWRDVNEHRKEQKAKRAPAEAKRAAKEWAELVKQGHDVDELNPHGPHLRINGRVNYWPSSQTWTVNNSKMRGVGFRSLIKYLSKAF